MTEKYQGWANYETWCVNLWLTNDQGTDSEFRDMAKEYMKDTEFREHERYEFSKAIKERVEEETETILEGFSGGTYSGMISDIFHANLSLVDRRYRSFTHFRQISHNIE